MRCPTVGRMTLGELERQVMDIIWSSDGSPLSVRDMADQFPDHAYTTIMTVLGRLAKKGFLTETKVGRANMFSATSSREEYIASVLLRALDTTEDRQAVLVAFAGAMDASDRRVLRNLFARKDK